MSRMLSMLHSVFFKSLDVSDYPRQPSVANIYKRDSTVSRVDRLDQITRCELARVMTKESAGAFAFAFKASSFTQRRPALTDNPTAKMANVALIGSTGMVV